MNQVEDIETQIEDLISSGNYNQAINVIEELEDNTSREVYILLMILKSETNRKIRKFDISIQILEELEQSVNSTFTSSFPLYIRYLIEKSYVMWYLCDYTASVDTLSLAEEKLLKIKDQNQKQKLNAFIHLLKGNISFTNGLYQDAIKYYKISYKLKTENKDNKDLSIILSNLGGVYQILGVLEKSEYYYQQALKYSINEKNPHGIAMNQVLSNLIKYYSGKQDTLEELENSLNDMQLYESSRYTAEFMSDLIRIGISKGDKDLIFKYLDKLNSLAVKTKDPLIKVHYKFAYSSYLRSDERLENKVKGAVMMRELASSELDFDLKIKSIKSYTEYLLDEYQLYRLSSVLSEIEMYINQIYELSLRQHMVPLILESLLIKSNLAIIMGNKDKFKSNMDEIDVYTKKYGNNVNISIHEVKSRLQHRINMRLKDETSVNEIAEISHIHDYLRDVSKFLNGQ